MITRLEDSRLEDEGKQGSNLVFNLTILQSLNFTIYS